MSNLLDLSDFRGVSRSYTTLHGTAGWPECRNCGSSLAGRRESVKRVPNTSTTATVEVELYRCPCGTGRRVKRELAV